MSVMLRPTPLSTVEAALHLAISGSKQEGSKHAAFPHVHGQLLKVLADGMHVQLYNNYDAAACSAQQEVPYVWQVAELLYQQTPAGCAQHA